MPSSHDGKRHRQQRTRGARSLPLRRIALPRVRSACGPIGQCTYWPRTAAAKCNFQLHVRGATTSQMGVRCRLICTGCGESAFIARRRCASRRALHSQLMSGVDRAGRLLAGGDAALAPGKKLRAGRTLRPRYAHLQSGCFASYFASGADGGPTHLPRPSPPPRCMGPAWHMLLAVILAQERVEGARCDLHRQNFSSFAALLSSEDDKACADRRLWRGCGRLCRLRGEPGRRATGRRGWAAFDVADDNRPGA